MKIKEIEIEELRTKCVDLLSRTFLQLRQNPTEDDIVMLAVILAEANKNSEIMKGEGDGERNKIFANAFGREVMERHLDICLDAGINVEGTNAEVAAGQWEFQTFAEGAQKAGDEMWVARYFLERLAEEYGLKIEYHPKPLGATDWNGSGMHANFSNTTLRTCGSKETYETICEAFRPVVKEHIDVYGAYNDQRLTGDHETQSITEFSYGVSDRGASIRIPIMTVEKGYKGWLEDRRPASNGDPYKIAGRIIKTVKSAKV